MKSKSIKGNSTSEISSAVKQSMADALSIDFAIFFILVVQDRTAITKMLNEKSIAIFGYTTHCEIIDEETEKGSVAKLLLNNLINLKCYYHLQWNSTANPLKKYFKLFSQQNQLGKALAWASV